MQTRVPRTGSAHTLDALEPVTKLFTLASLLCLVAAATGGCDEKLPASPPSKQAELPTGRAADYAGLIKELRSAGLRAERGEEVEQPFLSLKGKMIKIGDQDVQVFQYVDAAQVEAQAARVSPDGDTVGTSKIRWIGSPHFFKQDKLLILYLGEDEKVLKALEAVLGRQFAGK